MPVEIPDMQVLDRPGTIRWAVGSPEGPRSCTWSVVGHGTTDDVYIGPRERMTDIKLSLHKSTWRLAYTSEARDRYLSDDVDRVLYRWTPTPEIARGWQRGACVVIAPSNMGIGYDEPRVRRGVQVPFFPPAASGFGLRFDLMIGRPDRENLTVNQAAANVGCMTLRSGMAVWIVASEVPVTDQFESMLTDLRRSGREPGETARPTMRGWAWAVDPDGGVPVLFDISRME